MHRFFALLPFLLLPACGDLLSVHPLATPATTVFDASLLGEWQCAGKDCKGMVVLREGANRGYDIVWVPGEADGEPLRMQGRLVKVGSREVMDVIAIRDRTFSVPGHFFLLMQRTGDGVRFQWLDSEWLRNQAAAPGVVAHAMVDDKPVLTAEGGALQTFLAKYGLDVRAVSGTMDFRRPVTAARRGA